MEEMRAMALAEYEHVTDEEKVIYQNDFTQPIAEGSVSKYLRPLVDEYYAEKCLEMYKGYTRGRFDFNDYITLRYILMNKTVLQCDGCGSLILGQAFFSSHDCFFNSPKSYDLCCSCYASERFEDHNHSQFYNSRRLLGVSRTILLAETSDPKEKSEFIEGVMIDFAMDFMELAGSIKTERWKDFRGRIPDNVDCRDLIFRRLTEIKPWQLWPAKEMSTKYAETEHHALGSSQNIAGKDTKEEENSIKLPPPGLHL